MKPSNPDTEKVMLHRMAQGDVDGFNWVYKKYREWAFLKSLDYKESDVVFEDVLQNVFMTLWIKRESLLREHMDLSRYLFVTIRNHFYNHFKLTKRRKKCLELYRSGLSDVFFEVEEKLVAKEYYSYYKEGLDKLTPSQRKVYYMAEDGMRYKEIAKTLNICLNTVNVIRFNANKKVRETVDRRMNADNYFDEVSHESFLRA